MRSLFLLRILASRLRATHPSFALRIVTSRSDFAKLDTTTNEKDLGVRVDSNLTFEHHVEDVVNKANIMLGMTRAYIFLDGPTLINLHTSLIRPLLEYSNVALTPVLKRDQLLLDNVQRRATKKMWTNDTVWMLLSWIFKKPLIKCREHDYCKSFLRMK